MEFYFFRKINEPYIDEFRELAMFHNVRTSRVFAAIISVLTFILYLVDLHTNSEQVLHYPDEYAAAISFLLASSVACCTLMFACRLLPADVALSCNKLMSHAYAVVILIASLWITFVMQHNPSNTMSILVLGIIMVAALWIFDEPYAIAIAISIILLFDGGLRYFQTDPCKLFANYITGTCVAIFFLCISRITFSINYNHFKQMKKIERDARDLAMVNAVQTEILAVVAHDLHAPINNVVTIVDILKNPDTSETDRLEFYDMILTTCRRSDTIIDELLTVAKQNEQDTVFTKTNVNAFIGDMVHYFVHVRKATANIIYTPSHPIVYASINKAKMMRVFDNIISNAIKFTPGDGTIKIDLVQDKKKIYITIRDNGIGIPASFLPQLFTRFSKAGRTGLQGQKSYGLGLSICKLIMAQHHGDISVTSIEGSGTTITLTLPADDENKLKGPL